MFQIKVVEKIKTHILCSVTLFRKSCRLRDNVEKYYGARGSTNDVTTWRIRFACWIWKATRRHTHTHAQAHAHTHKYVIVIAFPRQQLLSERTSILRYPLVQNSPQFPKIHYAYLSSDFGQKSAKKTCSYVLLSMPHADMSPWQHVCTLLH